GFSVWMIFLNKFSSVRKVTSSTRRSVSTSWRAAAPWENVVATELLVGRDAAVRMEVRVLSAACSCASAAFEFAVICCDSGKSCPKIFGRADGRSRHSRDSRAGLKEGTADRQRMQGTPVGDTGPERASTLLRQQGLLTLTLFALAQSRIKGE